MNEQIAHLMKTLDCTEAEALDILQQDKAIDRGQRVSFDLSKEDEKRAKKYANTDTHKRPANPVHRERKPDENKRNIILSLNSFLVDFVHEYDENCIDDDVCMTNPERQIDFTFKGKRYRIVLSAPRK